MPLKIQLPTSTEFFDLQVSLEDVTYTIEIRWNVRASGWFMNVLDQAGDVVINAGFRLVADFPFNMHRTGRQPPGFFILNDTSGEGLDPGFDDLGARHQLLYYTRAELAI